MFNCSFPPAWECRSPNQSWLIGTPVGAPGVARAVTHAHFIRAPLCSDGSWLTEVRQLAQVSQAVCDNRTTSRRCGQRSRARVTPTGGEGYPHNTSQGTNRRVVVPSRSQTAQWSQWSGHLRSKRHSTIYTFIFMSNIAVADCGIRRKGVWIGCTCTAKTKETRPCR